MVSRGSRGLSFTPNERLKPLGQLIKNKFQSGVVGVNGFREILLISANFFISGIIRNFLESKI